MGMFTQKAQIVRYGMEEVTGRNETEMQGATNLLLYLAEM